PPVPIDDQIAAAVLAAPEDRRAGATVLGYRTSTSQLEVLRQGDNDLECVTDEPADSGFSVACYHRSLAPYMKRGRELAAEGVKGGERNRRRWAEAEAGTLAMPTSPATLYVLTGASFDATTQTVDDPYLRYVVYIPGATAESTGLPLSPTSPGGPWIMFPGTPGAHIMLNPPRPEAGPP
ncbi:MAG: hypothetical protein AAF602_30415, partial [Myxococcota bacterium]